MAKTAETQTPRPWSGRIYLLVGLVLLGLSLRHAITGVAPLLSSIAADIALGTFGQTLLGMLPTIAFGIAGFVTPSIIRRLGAVPVALVALGLGAFGTIARVLGSEAAVFLIFGAVALFGMGMGNVVGPPLVKRFFPDRQGTAMTLLTLTMQAGATIPAMLAVPLVNAAGWRVAVGAWAGLMLAAAIPWAFALARERGDTAGQPAIAAKDSAFGAKVLFRNAVSLGAALFYGMAALNTYAMLAWLPTIFTSRGLSTGAAATLFSIYTFLTLPMAIVAPILASKMKKPFMLGAVLSLTSAVGFLGIAFAPISTATLWAFIAGISGGAFPFAMTMFNLRTKTTVGSAAVSGFGMGFGYAFGTVGPFLGGLLSSLTGGWRLPLVVFALTAIPMLIGAAMLTRERKFEDLAKA